MRDINLLYGLVSEKKQFDLSAHRRRAGVLVLALVVLLAGGYGAILFANQHYITRINTLRAEAADYAQVSQAKAAITSMQTEIGGIESLLNAASGTSYIDTDFLWTLSSVLNENTFFTSAAITENASLSISGKSVTRSDINAFVYSLKNTGLFSDVSIKMVNTEKPDDKDGAAEVYDFSITAALKGGADGE